MSPKVRAGSSSPPTAATQPIGPRILPARPDGDDRPRPLRPQRGVRVERAVQADDHPERRPDRRIARRVEREQREERAWGERRPEPERDVVPGGQEEDGAMELEPGHR
jgi:hypothetical protein